MKIQYAFVLVLALLLEGCASQNYNYTDAPTLGGMLSKRVVIGYDGEPKPIEDVGVVTTDGILQIRSIDGIPEKNHRIYKTSGFGGGRYQLHLLPGMHILSLWFSYNDGNASKWSTSDLIRPIELKKGQILHLSLLDSGSTWNVLPSDGSAALSAIKADYLELTQGETSPSAAAAAKQ